MKKYLLTIIIFLSITNCTLNKVVKHHGVHFLDKKHNKLILNISNKNDIINEFQSRLVNSNINSEIDISIEQVKRIALLRLEELIDG